MNKIPMLERFAAQSLVEYDGELIFSKENFAELIVRECARVARNNTPDTEECEYTHLVSEAIKKHFGVEE